ncbi:MAG: hypothetical protein Q9162_007711 [Coniocarpon cinnabarinum]
MDESSTVDETARDLSRLLGRLELRLLLKAPSDPEIRSLRRSIYERNKVNANVEHARALLFRLEHESPQTRAGSASTRQNDWKSDLLEQRNLIMRLQRRLDDLAHEDQEGFESDASEEWSEDEDLAHLFAPAKSDVSSGIDTKTSSGPTIRPNDARSAAAAATFASTLRSRKGDENTFSPDSATASGSSAARPSATSSSTTPLGPPSTAKPRANDQASTAQLLESHDSEQVSITDNMVKLVSALKQSSLDFQESMNAGDPLVDAAAQALDKNVTGMAAAGKRMSALRRMTEGAGWWGRLNLYARVAVLWVVAILIGLVLPKLRF